MAALTALLPVKEYREGYLREAVDSIRAQSFPDWELVVIGEDENRAALGALLADDLVDARVRLVASEGRRLAGALNTGMRCAHTEFVAILLGDDMWGSQAVGVLHAAIRNNPGADFFHSARIVVDDDGRPLSSVHPARQRVSAADFRVSSPVKHLLCWRRALALSFGGMDETLPPIGTDDFDFPWTMAERGARFHALDECLYRYRDHREGYRLTTHLPLSVCVRGIRTTMRKHGLGRIQTERRVLAARRSYLRQCLYRSGLHERLRRDADPRHGWRDTYA